MFDKLPLLCNSLELKLESGHLPLSVFDDITSNNRVDITESVLLLFDLEEHQEVTLLVLRDVVVRQMD